MNNGLCRLSGVALARKCRWDFRSGGRQGAERCMMYFGDNARKVDLSCDISSSANLNAVSELLFAEMR